LRWKLPPTNRRGGRRSPRRLGGGEPGSDHGVLASPADCARPSVNVSAVRACARETTARRFSKLLGYARVSTADQDLSLQRQALKGASVHIAHLRQLQIAINIDAEDDAAQDFDRLPPWPAHSPTARRLKLQDAFVIHDVTFWCVCAFAMANVTYQYRNRACYGDVKSYPNWHVVRQPTATNA